MKLTTFIKSYKIALYNISEKVSTWKDVYLGDIIFPEDNETLLRFIFSSGYNMQQGDMGISASINIKSAERMTGGFDTIGTMTANALDKDVLAREYINHGEKINEAGRVIVLLETMMLRLRAMHPDTWEESNIDSLTFNFDKDIAEFCIDNSSIYTDGSLVMFG